ncbi:lipopolysaccharide biosynthesis protein [Lichenicoccus sp.]|uniref:lipopolysaccharide biosynthesis protein n=1 Tax=Lichenicoccus sp. TaxID=2781899 RepID=UPI003D134ECA
MSPMMLKLRPLLMLFGGTFGAALLSMGAQLLLIHALTVPDYGRLATILAAVNLLSPFAGFGVNWFWIQAFGREGYRGFRWVGPSFSLLGLTNLLSLLALAGYIVSAGGFAGHSMGLVVLFSSLMLLGQCAVEIASVKFQLEERFGQLALWQALSQLGRFLVALALIYHARSLHAVMEGYGFVGLLLLLGSAVIIRSFHTRRLKLAGHGPAEGDRILEPPSPLTTAKLSFPFAFITIFYLVYSQSVLLLITFFIGPGDTAVFSGALLVISAIQLVPNIIFTKFLMGRICRWAEHDHASFHAILHLSAAGMIVLGVMVMVLVAVGAPLAVPVIFGARYARTTMVLIYLTPTIPLRFVQSAYSSMLVSEANVRKRVMFSGVSAACSLALNLLLLPTLGLTGAIIASIASEAVLLLLGMWGAARYVGNLNIGDSFRLTSLRSATHQIFRGAAW